MPRGAFLLALLAAAPAFACPVEGMQGARDAPGAAAAHAAIIAAGTACTAEQREWAGRLAAAHHLQGAVRLSQQGRPPAEVIAAADAALRFAPLWQAYVLRGDQRQRMRDAQGRVDYAAASLDYQTALNEIEAGDERTDPVPRETIASIFRRAEQTRMLAERIVASPRTRSGAPGGLAARQVRGFRSTGVSEPIQFVFGTATATPFGAEAALQLAAMLAEANFPPIILVGHTDPVGSKEANMALSHARAEAVARFLIGRGYPPGHIRIVGVGFDRPPQIEGRENYTLAEVHQIMRRVEVQRP